MGVTMTLSLARPSERRRVRQRVSWGVCSVEPSNSSECRSRSGSRRLWGSGRGRWRSPPLAPRATRAVAASARGLKNRPHAAQLCTSHRWAAYLPPTCDSVSGAPSASGTAGQIEKPLESKLHIGSRAKRPRNSVKITRIPSGEIGLSSPAVARQPWYRLVSKA